MYKNFLDLDNNNNNGKDAIFDKGLHTENGITIVDNPKKITAAPKKKEINISEELDVVQQYEWQFWSHIIFPKSSNTTIFLDRYHMEKFVNSFRVVPSRIPNISTKPCFLWKNKVEYNKIIKFKIKKKNHSCKRLIYEHCYGNLEKKSKVSQLCPRSKDCVQPCHLRTIKSTVEDDDDDDDQDSLMSEAACSPSSIIDYPNSYYNEEEKNTVHLDFIYKIDSNEQNFKPHAREEDQISVGSNIIFDEKTIGPGSPDG